MAKKTESKAKPLYHATLVRRRGSWFAAPETKKDRLAVEKMNLNDGNELFAALSKAVLGSSAGKLKFAELRRLDPFAILSGKKPVPWTIRMKPKKSKMLLKMRATHTCIQCYRINGWVYCGLYSC